MMTYPYIGTVLQTYLKAGLGGIRVTTEVPSSRPQRLVNLTVVPAGSSDKPEHLSWRRVIAHCWDADEESAGGLAEQVRGLLLASRYEKIGIRKVVIIGEPGKFNDPDDDAPRFQLTADFLLRNNPHN